MARYRDGEGGEGVKAIASAPTITDCRRAPRRAHPRAGPGHKAAQGPGSHGQPAATYPAITFFTTAESLWRMAWKPFEASLVIQFICNERRCPSKG